MVIYKHNLIMFVTVDVLKPHSTIKIRGFQRFVISKRGQIEYFWGQIEYFFY